MTKHVLAGVLVCLLVHPRAGFPCGNAIFLETDEATRLIAKAEKALQSGKYRKASRLLHGGDVRVRSAGLYKRIRVVTAVANLRRSRVAEAAWQLDRLHQDNPKDPFIKTRLGEVLSRIGTKRANDKGLEILSALDRKDLIADEHGYEALAVLYHRAGRLADRDRALTRCRSIAKNGDVCGDRLKPKARPKPQPKNKSSKTFNQS
jgi:predicted Zn-dependent protease